MSLLDELGISPEEFIWEDLALCSGTDLYNIFFEEYESDKATAIQVDELCLSCPVFKQCYEKGRNGQWGVWAATYWNGAGKEDPMKNMHKTDEVRERIRQRLEE